VLETAAAFEEGLAAIQAESRVSPAELQDHRLRLEQIARASQEAARIRLANQAKPPYHQLVEHFLDCAQRYAKLVDDALEMDSQLQFTERFWQLALIGVHLQKKNLDTIASLGRSLTGVRALARVSRILWPAPLAQRCNETSDDLSDLLETIALGLNAEFREEMLRRLGELPDDVKA
jgi:hypothetical protein